MIDSRTVRAATLFAVALLAGVVTVTTVTAAPDCTDRDPNTSADYGPPDECTNANTVGTTVNGVDAVTFWKLWSGDADSVAPTLSERGAANRTKLERVRGLSPAVDFAFEQPPAATNRWNRNDHRDFSPGGLDRSTYPARADTLSTRITHATVYDAHVTLFSVDPSTIVHTDGSTTRYVRPEGTVRAVADFRAESDSSSGWCSDSYSITDTNTTVRLTVDGDIADTTDSKTATLDYGGLNDTHTLQVVAEYEFDIKHVNRWEVEHDDHTYCRSSTHYHTDTVSVSSDAADVTVHEPPMAEARQFIHRDANATGVLLNYDGRWASIKLGELTVYSGWQFYTESRPGYGRMHVNDGGQTTVSNSTVRPLETHAYTTNETSTSVVDDDIPGGSLLVDQVNRTTQNGTTGLPPRISHTADTPHGAVQSMTVASTRTNWLDIQNAGGRFDSWYSEFPFLSPPEPDYRVTGFVHGTSTSISPPPVENVYEVDINIAERSVGEDTYEYVLNVSDSRGVSVDEGQVVVDGKTVPVSNGTAVATLENGGITVNARYEPPKWRGDGPYYEDTNIVVPRDGGSVPSALALFRFAAMVFAWAIPFAVLLMALDYVFGTRFFRDSLPSVHAVFRGIYDAIWRGRR